MLDRPQTRSAPADVKTPAPGPAPRSRRRIALAAAIGLGVFAAGIVFGNYASDAQLMTQAKAAVAKAIARGQREAATLENWRPLSTHLHDVETVTIALPSTRGAGGGLAPIGDKILYAQPWGDFGYLDAAGAAHPIAGLRAPMNQSGMLARVADARNFDRNYFRVTDILAEPRGDGRVRLFVGHHRYMNDCVELWLSTIDLRTDGDALAPDGDWRTLYRVKPCVTFRPATFYTMFEGHFSGGRIVRQDARHVLFSVGDFGWDGVEDVPAAARDASTDLGKILQIDSETGAARPYAVGLRNGQGLLIDSAARVWETEHGPKGGDELNLIRDSGDYGWPMATLGVQYGGRPWPLNTEQGRHGVGAPPIYAWVPSIGVSNLIEAPATQFPRWRGDLLVGSLVDNGLWRVRLEGDRVQYTERLPFDGERLRDIVALPDGRVAMLTDSHKVILMRRAATERTLADASARTAQPGVAPDARTPESAAGRRVFQTACASCHTLTGVASIGPSLKGVIGRKVGGDDFPYSNALASQTAAWDRARLASFLADPRGMYPGTTMARVELTKDETDRLITYLDETR